MVRMARVGGSMQVGDLVWSRQWKMGVIVAVDWHTDIGTPFDYGVFFFDIARIEGVDDSCRFDGNLEVL